jgi:hypothetical protein
MRKRLRDGRKEASNNLSSEWNRLPREKQRHRVAMKKAWRQAQPPAKKEDARRRDREAKARKRRNLTDAQLKEVQRREWESKELRRRQLPEERRAAIRAFDRERQARRRASQREDSVRRQAEKAKGGTSRQPAIATVQNISSIFSGIVCVDDEGGGSSGRESSGNFPIAAVPGMLAAEDIRVDLEISDCLEDCLFPPTFQPDPLMILDDKLGYNSSP